MKHHSLFRLICLLLVLTMTLQITVLAVPDSAADMTEETIIEVTPADGEEAAPESAEAESTEAADVPDSEPAEEPASEEPVSEEASDEAAPVEESVEEPAVEEPAAEEPADDKATPEELGITIPAGWSYNALYFAVVNGILNGTTGGDLQATAPATRAQMAAILTRMIDAADTKGHTFVSGEKLDVYTDVDTNLWYAPYLSVAVRLGIFNGVSSTKLAPNNNITREQAFTVIGRTFGLQDGSRSDFSSFADADQVSSYAVEYVGALVKAGYVNGDKHNNLNPKANISRQELAQVLYNMFSKKGAICETAASLPETGTVLYTSSEAIPAGTHIQGNLILAVSTPAEMTLENVNIDGTLTVVMQDNSTLTCTGCSAASVVVLSRTAVSFDTKVQSLYITGADGASYNGIAALATVSADATVAGKYGTITVTAREFTVAEGTQVDRLTLNCRNGVCNLNGSVQVAEILQKYYTLQGSGHADKITVHGKGYSITCGYGELVEDLDQGLTGTKLTMSTGHKVSIADPTAYAKATVTGVNTGYGASNGVRSCTIRWYVDGVLKQSNSIKVSEGTVASFNYTYTFTSSMATSSTIKAVLVYDDEEISGTTNVVVDKTVNIPQVNGTISGGDYTTYEKEVFVNSKGYSSSSGYLVWINLYKTKVNVFTGSKGNWKLVKAFSCGIGTPSTPTPPGIYRMQTHEPYSRWSYGSWYVDCISRWNGAYAFHTRARLTSNGAYFTNDINAMVSHGCIRMNVEEAQWMYKVPLGSTVVVY